MKNILTIIIIITYLSVFSQKKDYLKIALDLYYNYEYNLAIKPFQKTWKKNKKDININYMYAVCIIKSTTDRALAIPLLEYIYSVDTMYKDANFYLTKAYMHASNYDKADETLKYFLSYYKNKKKEDLISEAVVLLKQIKTAKKLIKKPLNVSIVNLGKRINSKHSEYNPFISSNGRSLFFSSNKKSDLFFEEQITNIYSSNYNNDTSWSKMKSLGKKINSSEHEIIVGLSKKETKIIIQASIKNHPSNLYTSTKDEKRFGNLDVLSQVINTNYNENSADYSYNEDSVFFSSNKPGGFGGQDIYLSIKLPNGEWGIPKNLGPEINTEFNESYPSINNNGEILYFSSDRPESMGGYDIFSCTKSANSWDKINNIGYPLNDSYDNYTISFSSSQRYAYVAKIRPEGFGSYDIYQVIYNEVSPQNTAYTGSISIGLDNNNRIKESITIKSYYADSGKKFGTYKLNKIGDYTFAFPPGNYIIKITGKSIKPYKMPITIKENENFQLIIENNIIVSPKI